ncbi:MAG: S4 domain-containing protein [Xanthomonadales bacterium]|nr:S4 domain-containing protein [Xanthomonadales bacterium]
MESVRLDKWLWAARFFKTRNLARAAVEGGRVHVNETRVKPARAVRVGDLLEISRGEIHWRVEVAGLAERRGPASEAQKLYSETPESIERREEAARERREKRLRREADGRPSKRDRRELTRLKRGGESA